MASRNYLVILLIQMNILGSIFFRIYSNHKNECLGIACQDINIYSLFKMSIL